MSIHDILAAAMQQNRLVLMGPVETPAVEVPAVDLNAAAIQHLVSDEREINVKVVYVHTETFEMERRVTVEGPQDTWERQITNQLNELTDIPVYEWASPVDKDTVLERWSFHGGA
jgi:hypothetical protein